MRIKSGVWYWLAMACFVVGLLYGMGLEGSFQTGGTVSDADFITAMVLILLSELFPARQTTAAAGEPLDTAAYQTQLEQRLETLVSQMSGAGKTTVMVTLETGEESVYAVDTQSGELQTQNTHVLLDDGSALTETVYLPQVQGVAVLCEGGGDVRMAARITEMIGALLDLPSNRICVEQRR